MIEYIFVDDKEKLEAWLKLHRAIEEAPEQIPCATTDPELFYNENGGTNRARSLCASCPVVAECYSYGMEYEIWGVWGGTTAGERHEIRQARARMARGRMRADSPTLAS